MLLQVQHLSSTSFSNAEERVQQLLHLQLAQRQEVAALSSALQAANIRVQTLETQLRTAQAAPHPPAVSLTHLTSFNFARRVSLPRRICRVQTTRICSSCAMNSWLRSGAPTMLS